MRLCFVFASVISITGIIAVSVVNSYLVLFLNILELASAKSSRTNRLPNKAQYLIRFNEVARLALLCNKAAV
jgi:hypothetical protein